jgi:cold shock CspA family protein
MHGTIARMAPAEGFGFIDGDDGHEYFFHRTALNATRFEDLAPGVAVDFRIGRGEGDRPDEGPRAIFVRLADAAEPAVDPPMDQIDEPPSASQ